VARDPVRSVGSGKHPKARIRRSRVELLDGAHIDDGPAVLGNCPVNARTQISALLARFQTPGFDGNDAHQSLAPCAVTGLSISV